VQYPHDNKRGYQSPIQQNLDFINLTLTTADNVNIRGWFMFSNESHKETPTIVFMHENAGNLGYRIPYFKHVIQSLGVNILAIAYRGYSYSDPVAPTEAGLKLDADAIL
jgi:cephalosporin-C deacetylase-like acetyl esterase